MQREWQAVTATANAGPLLGRTMLQLILTKDEKGATMCGAECDPPGKKMEQV